QNINKKTLVVRPADNQISDQRQNERSAVGRRRSSRGQRLKIRSGWKLTEHLLPTSWLVACLSAVNVNARPRAIGLLLRAINSTPGLELAGRRGLKVKVGP